MHMDGLLAIIRARGGVHKIDHNHILRLLVSGYVLKSFSALTV